MNIHSQANAQGFLEAYKDVLGGPTIYPRGTVCRERENAILQLSLIGSPLTSFKARKLNLRYAKEEFAWYVRADAFDRSIEQHASMWPKILQPDGSYFSNYGQYIFPEQFSFVVEELIRDPWTRRASIVLLKKEHLFAENPDVVCTYAMNFRIRDQKLNMTTHMRSNDIIFGMTNDVFCFHMVYRMVYSIVSAQVHVKPGTYTHVVDSLHVYQRHFDMIKTLVDEGMNGYEEIYVPWPTPNEALSAVHNRRIDAFQGEWSKWLTE